MTDFATFRSDPVSCAGAISPLTFKPPRVTKQKPRRSGVFDKKSKLTVKPRSFHRKRRGQAFILSPRVTKQKPRRSGVFDKKSKLTVKPGSVVDSHSSRPAIAHWLKQPTRVQYGPYLVNPYLALLRVEFTVPRTVASRAVRSYRTLSPLPDPISGPSAVCSLLHWS
ncbi:hypothetical protein PAP10c_2660 [Pantoea agglomerans]|nr:hypothetical protein PAP10c_2660 [Pantoea agglomerans]